MGRLSGCVAFSLSLSLSLLFFLSPRVHVLTDQIRIVKDTHADEKGNKKRKPHRGYAFVVFEREKDMRGKKS